MSRKIRVGIIGEYNPDISYHLATNAALGHAADALSVTISTDWIPTGPLAGETCEKTLKGFDALFAAPCDYNSVEGALRAIRFAREKDRPFLGT
ncbi:MAG: hypothetical protein MI863_23485 [Desulfobacterales bacterium]|nr:hypothetical protein [Desulfobacterales bacterium]